MIADPHPFVSRFRAGIARLARIFSASRAAPAIRPAIVLAREPRRVPEVPGVGAAVITRTRAQTRRPNMYRVLLLNDDYTPMEFVIAILQAFFNKSPEEATQIMLHVHNNGVGECGVYTYEVAKRNHARDGPRARKSASSAMHNGKKMKGL